MIKLRTILIGLNLVLLGSASMYLAAQISDYARGAMVGAMLPPPKVQPKDDGSSTRARLPLAHFEAINEINVFKARRTKVGAENNNSPDTPIGSPAVVGGPTELPVILKGTVNFGKASFAMVADRGGNNEKLYSTNECLPSSEDSPPTECQPNQGKLLRVHQDHIEVFYQGKVVLIAMADDAPPAAATAQSTRTAPSVAQKKSSGESSNGAPFPMTQEGNRIAVSVPSGEVEKAFENFAEVMKQARVVPYSGDGVQGFQIRNIQPGSIFQRIGLRNFDVIKSVNGESITTADQALRLMTAFRNETNIDLELKRRNQDISLGYSIQ